jgi:hypothetical protein
MGMFDWFRRVAAGNNPEATTAVTQPLAGAANPAESEVGGLDFYKAIAAHQRWKVRLSAYVKGESNEQLNWQVICKDDQCDLGKWLHHDARVPHAQFSLFTRLIEEHAEFHRRAGEVVQLTDEGLQDAALKLVTNGDYARASHKVIGTLSQLFLALSEFHKPGSTQH